jgi:hypothetical protein
LLQLPLAEAMVAPREELEAGLTLGGFMVVGNELKDMTVPTLATVAAAGKG